MREEKFHIYLNDDEYSRLIQSLIRLKNSLTAQGRYQMRPLSVIR